ncbi:MAG: hypothetical protein RL026_1818 [Pseudomonadota bacterium]|jgi:hypothetical protein
MTMPQEKRHSILDAEQHRGLRIRTGAGPALGDGVMSCLAVPAEFRRLACDYPLLFHFDARIRRFGAVALFGFAPGENLYLEDGQWNASCRPLAMAVAPFLVGRRADGQGPAQIHIDLGHPRVSQDGEGQRVFDDTGQPTPFLEEAGNMLAALDEGYQRSTDFFLALAQHDLLEPFSMDVSAADGGQHRLVGYHLIDEDKLRALEPSAVAGLHTAGHLEPLYMALASLGNLAALVARKNRHHGG